MEIGAGQRLLSDQHDASLGRGVAVGVSVLRRFTAFKGVLLFVLPRL